jgi:hypothetical protein
LLNQKYYPTKKKSTKVESIYRSGKHNAKKIGYASIADYMTLDEFKIWYLCQKQECAICLRTDKLAVDHSHDTGEPIGILCHMHNNAEGHIRTVKLAESLLEYIKRKTNNMPSFQMHFGKNGEVIIDTIKGIPEGSNECLGLTGAYEQSLGTPIARTMLNGADSDYADINIQSGENA